MKTITACVILSITYCYVSPALAVTIGPGDVYQQSTASVQEEAVDIDLQGGTIIERADGRRTWFFESGFRASSGSVDTVLLVTRLSSDVNVSGGQFNDDATFDLGIPSLFGGQVNISGGQFNDDLRIDRSTANVSGGVVNGRFRIWRSRHDGFLTISGGTFHGLVDIWAYTGPVTIEGGDFRGGVNLSPSFGPGAVPTLTFAGTRWELDGQPLTYVNGEANITGQSGFLTGWLADGNRFSAELGVDDHPLSTTVLNIPEPTTATLAVCALVGLVGRWRRHT